MGAETKKIADQKVSSKMNPSVRVSFYVHEWIESIEARLKEPANTETCQNLFQELEITTTIIENAKEKLPSLSDTFSQTQATSRLQEAEEKIICLYGRITDLSIDSEISSLQEEAKELEACLQRDDVKEISIQVDNLKEHIFTFCNQCSLPKDKRQALKNVQTSIEKADAVLNREPAPTIQDYQNEMDLDIEDLEEVSAYFDIAYLIYKQKSKEALALYNQLTSSEKELFQHHLQALGMQNASFSENCLICVQALLACAYGLTKQNPKYLSVEEITLFFLELEENTKESVSG